MSEGDYFTTGIPVNTSEDIQDWNANDSVRQKHYLWVC